MSSLGWHSLSNCRDARVGLRGDSLPPRSHGYWWNSGIVRLALADVDGAVVASGLSLYLKLEGTGDLGFDFATSAAVQHSGHPRVDRLLFY